jgi:hypothetical protein
MGAMKAAVVGGKYEPRKSINIPTGKSLTVGGTTIDANTLAMDGLTASAAELNKLDNCTATTAELNLVDGQPATVAFAIAAGGANVAEVTITVKDAAGATLTGIRNLEVWLSDAATGAGLTGTTASGTVQAKSASGTVLTALTAKKHLTVQTLAAGTFVLEITDSAKTGFYVAVKNPMSGAPIVSTQLVTGSYGA